MHNNNFWSRNIKHKMGRIEVYVMIVNGHPFW